MISDLVFNNYIVLVLLFINFIVSIFYFFMISNNKMKNAFYGMPIVFQKLYVAFFVGPLFVSPFIPQPRYGFNILAVDIIGIIFSVCGISFILLSFLKIGVVPSIKSESGLSTTGMYGIVRHPIYSGTIILFLGLILFKESIIASIYFPISILLYYLMTVFEEKDLVNTFKNEYQDYRKIVKKRIIPFIL